MWKWNNRFFKLKKPEPVDGSGFLFMEILAKADCELFIFPRAKARGN